MNDTLFTGKNLIELNSVDSTNNYAKNLLTQGRPPEGTLVVAREQFAGRGQAGNNWKSAPGENLLMSLIVYPVFLAAEKQFFLNMAVALAVKDFCESVTGEEIKLKWPNDVYYRDKKLGGILIENTVQQGRISSSVIGVGLNINQVEFDSSLANPVSIAQIKPGKYDLATLMQALCPYFEKYYLQLRALHYNFLEKAYTEALYRYQQTYPFRKGERVFRGEINGITKEGKLIIHSHSRELKFGFKEVEFVL